MSKIYVGNIQWKTTEEDLKELFNPYGTVTSAQVIKDRDTGRSRGFGFVKMETEDQTKEAINGLNGKELNGRTLVINEARRS